MNRLKTILIVDDQPEIVEGIALALELAGYSVQPAGDGRAALAALERQPVDLIIADIAMPLMNGYQLLEEVRARAAWVGIPFLFLTARSLDSDIRYGKAMGIDDYLIKPIKPEDLLASVAGRLRRAEELSRGAPPATPAAGGAPASMGELRIGMLRILPDQHRIWMAEREIELSPREFKLLAHLAANVGAVIDPSRLIAASHGYQVDNLEAGQLLRPLIRSIRRKLGYPIGDMGCIENVRGIGYRLTEAV